MVVGVIESVIDNNYSSSWPDDGRRTLVCVFSVVPRAGAIETTPSILVAVVTVK